MAKGKGSGTHHVVPNAGGGWDVRRGGADRGGWLPVGQHWRSAL